MMVHFVMIFGSSIPSSTKNVIKFGFPLKKLSKLSGFAHVLYVHWDIMLLFLCVFSHCNSNVSILKPLLSWAECADGVLAIAV